MLNRQSSLLLIIFAFLLVTSAVSAADADQRRGNGPELTRDSIIENHKRRRSQLQKLLVESQKKVDDHESGHNKLEGEDEYALHKKRLDLYQRKLDSMNEEPDEREIQKMLQREQMRAERYLHREL